MAGKLENHLDDGRGARILVVVDRPLQLLSALCVVMTIFEKRMKDVDIAIEPSFLGSKDVVDRLRASELVADVFLGAGSGGRPKSIGKMMFRTALRPKKFREEMLGWFGEEFPELVNRQYCTLICGSINAATVSAKQCCCSAANVIMVDEGLGSHDGTVFRRFSCMDDVFGGLSGGGAQYAVKKIIKSIVSNLSRGEFDMNISELFLYSFDEREMNLYRNIRLSQIIIPSDLSALQEMLIDRDEVADYASTRTFFLPVSGSAPSKRKTREVELIALCGKYCCGLTIKNHPSRSSSDFCNLPQKVIGAKSSWEIALLSGWIDEQSILIGINSSAMFNPKQLAGIEPNCVFLYKLIGDETIDLERMDKSVEDLKGLYNNKHKVFVPDSEEELKQILIDLSKGK